jgi:hypothetical protein
LDADAISSPCKKLGVLLPPFSVQLSVVAFRLLSNHNHFSPRGLTLLQHLFHETDSEKRKFPPADAIINRDHHPRKSQRLRDTTVV